MFVLQSNIFNFEPRNIKTSSNPHSPTILFSVGYVTECIEYKTMTDIQKYIMIYIL